VTADASFCPYVGLQPFTVEDRPYFFGREREIRLVGANLYAAKLTVLYGESGVGKSSVLMAGVVPELRQKPRTAVVMFRDWQRPDALSILRAAVAHAGDEAAGKPLGLDAGTPLDDLLATAGKAIGGTTLVLLDQFEEYFLYYPPGGAGDEFDAELARAVNRRDVNAGFVLSIREDSLSKLDRFRARIPTVLANPLRIRHLRPADARDAIRKPLDVYNQRPDTAAKPASIEPALVDALIEQTISGRVSLAHTGVAKDTRAETDERVEAPYLQLVLTRLWKEEGGRGSRVLRLATLEALKGASQIVRTHLDQVMSMLSPDDQALCADFFDRLVTPSGTKIACRLDDLKQWAGPGRVSDVERVVKALAAPEARILRAIQPLPGQPIQYEIFHDVLAAGVLDWRSRIVEEKKLKEAQAEAERQRKEAERERERADELAAARIRQRRLIWGLSALLLLVVGASVFAARQKYLAEEQARRAAISRDYARYQQHIAGEQQLIAEDNAKHADEQREIADQQRRQADQAAREALARQLATESSARLTDDPDRAQLLAVQAYSIAKVSPAELALRVAFDAFTGLSATLHGHSRGVKQGAFRPDGEVIVTASYDGTARLWDISGNLLKELKGHLGPVQHAAFSPDGKLIVTASEDDTARLWDASGNLLKVLKGHDRDVMHAAFSPNGKLILTTSHDQTARLWNASGDLLKVLERQSGRVQHGAFSPDGRYIVTASASTVRLWDANGNPFKELSGHRGEVLHAAFSTDGKRIVTASHDGTARLWDASGNLLKELKGHGRSVQHAVFSPDGLLVLTSDDEIAHLWDASGNLLKELKGHKGHVQHAAFSTDGKRIVTASHDGTARLWDASGNLLKQLKGHKGWVDHVAFSPDSKLILTASRDMTARLWDASGNPFKELEGGHVAFSPDSKYIATASGDTARLWDASGNPLKELEGHRNHVWHAVFSPDGKRILTTSHDETARLWDANGNLLKVLQGHNGGVRHAAFSPNRTLIVTASEDHTARLWDGNGHPLKELAGHSGRVLHTAFSPDGKLIVTADEDETARLWDTSGNLLKELKGRHVAFSPDSKYIVTASGDTARLWDASGNPLKELKGHTGTVWRVAFSPDGKYIFTASSDTTARLWDDRGNPLKELEGHEREVSHVAFSPDGKYMVTASGSTARLWPCIFCEQPEKMTAAIKRRVGRELTNEERQLSGLLPHGTEQQPGRSGISAQATR
jgi:WD40 repeat protein